MEMLSDRREAAVTTEQPEAIIYRPARGVMQAGSSLTHRWCLEFAPQERERLDPLMGWPGSSDTRQEVTLHFPTRQAAEAYARHRRIRYVVRAPHDESMQRRTYADNFRPDRIGLWSH